MTIFGWDSSHYDWDRGPVNVAAAVADGIKFMTHKLGGDATDQRFDDWWAKARVFPDDQLLLGAYWVLYPGDPVGRADRMIAALDTRAPGWRDRNGFMLQPDAEKWNGDQSTVPPLADLEAYCDRLHSRTGLTPLVYAPKWVYGNSLAGLRYPLWASSYVNTGGRYRDIYPGDDSSRWGAYSGQVPAILQYSSSAAIGTQQTKCDANAFRGTLDDLIELVGGDVAAPTAQEIVAALMAWDPPEKGKGITNPYANAATNPNISPRTAFAASALADVQTKAALAQLKTISATLTQLANKDAVDEAELVRLMWANLPARGVQEVAGILRAGMTPEQRLALAVELQRD